MWPVLSNRYHWHHVWRWHCMSRDQCSVSVELAVRVLYVRTHHWGSQQLAWSGLCRTSTSLSHRSTRLKSIFTNEGKSPKTELVSFMYGGLYLFWRDHRHVDVCTLASPGAAWVAGGVRCMAVRPVWFPTPGGKFPVQLASTYINLPPPFAKKSTF